MLRAYATFQRPFSLNWRKAVCRRRARRKAVLCCPGEKHTSSESCASRKTGHSEPTRVLTHSIPDVSRLQEWASLTQYSQSRSRCLKNALATLSRTRHRNGVLWGTATDRHRERRSDTHVFPRPCLCLLERSHRACERHVHRDGRRIAKVLCLEVLELSGRCSGALCKRKRTPHLCPPERPPVPDLGIVERERHHDVRQEKEASSPDCNRVLCLDRTPSRLGRLKATMNKWRCTLQPNMGYLRAGVRHELAHAEDYGLKLRRCHA